MRLIIKYLGYKIFAPHKRGHGIHSPFLYRFIREVLMNNEEQASFLKIEQIRRDLSKDKRIINYKEFGAGSGYFRSDQISLGHIVRISSVQPKYGKFLYKLARFVSPSDIIELGTSAGISTFYLAMAAMGKNVYTIEANSKLQEVAKEVSFRLVLSNIHFINGEFNQQLPLLLQKISGNFLAFIDGNHTDKASIEYFELLLTKTTAASVIVLDDIHWSAGMEKAWRYIQQHPRVILTVDLFFMGIVFFREKLQKENYIINY